MPRQLCIARERTVMVTKTPQLLTLSRAARLMGVTRGALQKKIKNGELSAFEGMISLTELLNAYPDAEARVQDDSMLERVKRIKDNALTKVVQDRVILPHAQVLAARVTSLSQELAEANAQLDRYSSLVEEFRDKFSQLRATGDTKLQPAIRSLEQWLLQRLDQQSEPTRSPPQLLVKDSFLRVMAAQIRIIPSEHEFFLEGSDTILEAALRAGLALNYGCSNGNCGLCKARILSGQVKKVRPCDYVFSAAEKAQGYELLCCNTAVTDLVVEAAEAGSAQEIPLQKIVTRVKGTQQLTDDIVLLHLQTPRTQRLRFLAGQNASLEVDDGLRRTYPIASCPCDDRNLQFHVKRLPGDPFTDYVFTELKHAGVVSLEGPRGEFVLREDSPRSVIFVAFDTGFAPIKSLIEHAMALDVAESMHLYWISPMSGGHYLHNLCRSWTDALDNFKYTPLVAANAPQAVTPEQAGSTERLLSQVADDHADLGDFDVYVAGPEPATVTAEFFFLDHGLPPGQLCIDRGPPIDAPESV
ncbi:MAG: 2Fe-2S iron-sulfur cluster-binding protein [Acidiferrobacterales bacterium]